MSSWAGSGSAAGQRRHGPNHATKAVIQRYRYADPVTFRVGMPQASIFPLFTASRCVIHPLGLACGVEGVLNVGDNIGPLRSCADLARHGQ